MGTRKVDILEYLFGSRVSARLLKFFFRHPQTAFRVGEVARQIDSNYNTTHSYIKKFEAISLLGVVTPPPKAEAVPEEEPKPKNEEDAKTYMLDSRFPLFEELRILVAKASPIAEGEVVSKLNEVGKVRLALFSGLFVGKDTIPIDLFIVADDVVTPKFEAFVKELEADVGRPLNYTVMDTNEFTYRFNIYDRFVRNVFKHPHLRLIDSLSLNLS